MNRPVDIATDRCAPCLAELDNFIQFASLGYQNTCNTTCISAHNVLAATLATLLQVSIEHGLTRETFDKIANTAWEGAELEHKAFHTERNKTLS